MADMKNPHLERLSWDETFMNLAFLVAQRTACRYHLCGVVFVDENKRIVSLGYNGPSIGDYHCNGVGCAKIDGNPITKKLERCRGVHAEINGIINAQDSSRLKDGTLYTTFFPCYDCMKALNNTGIKEIIYNDIYRRIQTGGEKFEEENEAADLAKRRNIITRKYEGKVYINLK